MAAELTEQQRQSLDQLMSITDGSDPQTATSVLESVDWDVQRATEVIFDGASPAATSRRPAPKVEAFEIDDSQQAPLTRRNAHSIQRAPAGSSGNTNPLLSLLALPFNLLTGFLRFVFGLLRIPFPARFGGLNFYRPLAGPPPRTTDPHTAADRWLRALEEETGAIRARASADVFASGSQPGPSSGLTRRPAGAGGVPTLPDFILSSYEEFLKICQDEARLGCVVLVTDEHDDVAAFKRSTLTNAAFVKALSDHNFAVWGGDVRDREAWSAGQKLQATTFPFVAFLALQPRRGAGSRSSSTPSLTVLSRHQGPSASPEGPTSPERIVDHIEHQLIPRAKPFLDRIHATRLERERERRLREEQEAALAEAMRKDKERIEARIAEAEAARRAKEAEAEAERRLQAEEAARAEWAATKMEWRRYARARLVPPEPSVGQGRGAVRVMVRLPDGTRLVRTFGADADLTALYAYVDAAFVPEVLQRAADPREPPAGIAPGEAGVVAQVAARGGADAFWGFRLAFGYPRREVPWAPGRRIDAVEGFRGGGQLVVEPVGQEAPRRKSAESSRPKPEDHDGYDTEESD